MRNQKIDKPRNRKIGTYLTADRQTETGTYFSYSRGHKTPRKHEISQSPDGLEYYTHLAYARKEKYTPSRLARPAARIIRSKFTSPKSNIDSK